MPSQPEANCSAERGPRILWVVGGFSPAVQLGGPIEASIRTCKGLRRTGARVRVLTTDFAGPTGRCTEPTGRWLRREGLAVRYCPTVGPLDVSIDFVRRLPRAMGESDIVHIVGVLSFVVPVAASVAFAMRRPYVVTTAGALEPWSLAHHGLRKLPAMPLVRAVLTHAALVHAKSAKEREALVSFGVQRPIVVIPNGVDPVEIGTATRASGHWRSRLGLAPDQPMLVCLGRIHVVKGIDVALTMMSHLRSSQPPACLVVAGPDQVGLRDKLRRQALALGVADAVRWLDFVAGAEKFQLLAEADVLLLPSRQENFGSVVVEALAVGTPVVASRLTPWEELETRHCGRWVELDPAVLARTVAELLADRDICKQMGVAGRALVAEKYTWDAVVRSLLEVYRAAGQGAASGRSS